MKQRTSINWGRWVREPKQDRRLVAEIRAIAKPTKRWATAAIIITILLASAGVVLNYWVGVQSSAKIDAAIRQMISAHQASIRQTINAINPNDFSFKPFEDSQWYRPAPVDEYVRLNIIPIQTREISLNLNIRNNSEFPARDVYCTIFFSNKEFVESGDDIVKRLKGLAGLNVDTVNSSDDYLNEALAFEWGSISPKMQKTLGRRVELTMKGNTARLTVKINTVNRLVFELRLQESKADR
jgi:hypothetical protein